MEELGQIYYDKSMNPEDFKRLRNEVLYFHDQVEFIYETTHRMSRSFIISLISFYCVFIFRIFSIHIDNLEWTFNWNWSIFYFKFVCCWI